MEKCQLCDIDIENHSKYFCHCCHIDLTSQASDKVKKNIDLNPLYAIICDECIDNKICSKLNYYPHTHTPEGIEEVKKRILESTNILEAMDILQDVSKKIGFPSFNEWLKMSDDEKSKWCS